RADAGCAAAFPGLEESFFALVKQLDAQPISVELKDPIGGALRQRSVSGTRLLALLQFAALDVVQIARIPAVLSQLAARNRAALCELRGEPIGPDTQDQGAFFATWCAEEQPFYTPALAAQAMRGLRPEIQLFAQGGAYFEEQACARWGLGDPPPVEN